MSEIEFNKIFASILVAGIIFMLSGFVAGLVFKEDKLKEQAYPIEGVGLETASTVEKIELPDPVLGLIADADVGLGEKISRQCAACHSFEQGGPNKIGPNLWNVVNADKGHITDYSYSSALMEKGGQWTYANLNKFLWRPDWYIDGTKMNYVGLSKPEHRAAIIAWMRTLADTPEPLPTEEEIAAEKAELSPPEPEPAPADEQAGAEGETTSGEQAEDSPEQAPDNGKQETGEPDRQKET